MYMTIFLIIATAAVFAPSPLYAKVQVSDSTESTESQDAKITWENDTTAVVKFCDRIIHPKDALIYSQQFHLFIRKIGRKHNNMVLSAPKSKVEFFQLTLASIFLKVAADENRIREREGLKPIKVFLHIPLKSFHDRNSLSDIQSLAVALVNYIGNDGIVSGVIFEISLIQTPIPAEGGAYGKEMNGAMSSTVVKFKKFLKSLELTFGYELKMGLALNSYEECITCLVSDVGEIISLFDFIVLNSSFMGYVGGVQGNEKKDAAYFAHCFKLFQEKFQELEFYHVGEIFELKNGKDDE